jgi:hypothetical protein
VAEILATENFEINAFGSKEEPRFSGQATALFLFEHSALYCLRMSNPFLGVQIVIAHFVGSLKCKELTRRILKEKKFYSKISSKT